VTYAVEYLRTDGSWGLGHQGVGLRDPKRYLAKLAENGYTARLTDVETREVIAGPCPVCGVVHSGAYDGSCLI
jgi:hypothetical protein